MKDKIFEIINMILKITLAAGFFVLIWGSFIIGIKIILTSVVAGVLLEELELEF